MAASKTPPRCGVSWPTTHVGASKKPTSARPLKSAWERLISVLREPHVLELLVREVTGRGDPVLHLGPVHDVARPPESRDLVRILQRNFLKLEDEALALGRVERPRLPVVQVVDRRVGEAAPVLRGPGDERC